LFDDKVVIIDEAHNLISRIVNKINKEKPISENSRGEKEHPPKFLSNKLYEYLLSANNARIVLLTGTPIINYPNEFGILFNILRGYIKTWEIQLDVKTTTKVDKNTIQEMLLGEKTLDYLDYSPSSKVLTITRNPYGFKNKIKKESGFQGVSNNKKNDEGITEFDVDVISDDDFERKIINILKRNNIEIVSNGVKIKNFKALPDTFELFEGQYINSNTKEIKNIDALKMRILGLTSFFKSAQESLLPRFNRELGVDYHVVRIPMSNFQFKIYEDARIAERKTEKPSKKPQASSGGVGELYKDSNSTYRIFSRLFCNFVMPGRPIPDKGNKTEYYTFKKSEFMKDAQQEKGVIVEEFIKNGEEWVTVAVKNKPSITPSLGVNIKPVVGEEVEAAEKAAAEEIEDISNILKEANTYNNKEDIDEDKEGEVEGDEILDKIGGFQYKERIEAALKYLKENSNEFLTPEALETYSPKY
jgi:hypothetical protein